MTKPKFKVGERVYIPKDAPVTDVFLGAKGEVVEVHSGTGPGMQLIEPKERPAWSTPTAYTVDFGPTFGKRRITEGLLEPESN